MPYLPNTDRPIYYRVWDVENPQANIAFFHGVGEHSGLYQRYAYMLNSAGYRVWAIDHIGHGGTAGKLEECYDLFHLAENGKNFVQFIQAEGGDIPLIINGHSMGGVMSSLLMSMDDRPDISALILIGTPLGHVELPGNFLDIPTSIDTKYAAGFDLDSLFPQEKINFERLESGFDKAQEFITPRLTDWTFPTLLINGEFDPFAPPIKEREWIKPLINARFFEIANGHHDLLTDWCYDTVTRIILGFVFESIAKPIKRR